MNALFGQCRNELLVQYPILFGDQVVSGLMEHPHSVTRVHHVRHGACYRITGEFQDTRQPDLKKLWVYAD
jgi:muramidase (phage lysozyme)